ncbi:hypothetical protein P6166_13015 [Stenotrophomonas sp. HITSZ_GD]|uniref:hypothetical protein n=1 Tax=Stenotrophomonas sp. HITSZ_GD TaxID=3037248 RepID=UPI00240DAD7C|nr:hypothetical protein [Stenotrophomonas sp. HITSZ_GD]MDG2526275.1 hypothetical protein [Stenotrophomonas sp. HITSZ_GD]
MSMQSILVQGPLVLACALLAQLGMFSVMAKRVFPSGQRRWDSHPVVQGALLLAALLLLAPLGVPARLSGAVFITAVVAGGTALALLRGREAACDCFGALTPKGPALHVALLLLACALDAVLWRQRGLLAEPFVRWAIPVAGGVLAGAAYLWLRLRRYQTAFYRPERLHGEVPERLAPEQVLGHSTSGQARQVGELLGTAPGLVVVALSSSCTSCYDLLERLSAHVSASADPLPVVVVSDHPRMFQRGTAGLVALVDPQVTIARHMRAEKLPLGFALNDDFELLAPPSSGNGSILGLLAMLDSIRTPDVATVP